MYKFLLLVVSLSVCLGCAHKANTNRECEVSIETKVPGAAVAYAKSCDAREGQCPPPDWFDAGRVTPFTIKLERCIYHFKSYRPERRGDKIENVDTGSLFFVDCTNEFKTVLIQETVFFCPICKKIHPLPHCQ